MTICERVCELQTCPFASLRMYRLHTSRLSNPHPALYQSRRRISYSSTAMRNMQMRTLYFLYWGGGQFFGSSYVAKLRMVQNTPKSFEVLFISLRKMKLQTQGIYLLKFQFIAHFNKQRFTIITKTKARVTDGLIGQFLQLICIVGCFLFSIFLWNIISNLLYTLSKINTIKKINP